MADATSSKSMHSAAEKRKPKVFSHGPTVNAIKRAKYEAKQERLRQSSLQQQQQFSGHPQSWFNGREEYAAFVTIEDVRDIRNLRNGKNTLVEEKGRITRLKQIADWIEPFFDLKETPNASSEREKLFISEGTEAVRMMVQHCAPMPNASSSSIPCINDESPPLGLLSILSKPATFFDAPIHLLRSIESRFFPNGSSSRPPFKIIIANEEALSEIVGFNVARGAMTCGVIPQYMQQNGYAWLKRLLCEESTKLPSRMSDTTSHQRPIRKLLALDAISNAANMGSILRTAAAFSIDAIILSDDSCDAWYRQSVRVSMGHVISVKTLRVADWDRGLANTDDGHGKENIGLAGFLRWLREQMNVECLAAVADDNNAKTFPPLVSLEAGQELGSRSWCCVLGNEGHGIRDEVIKECDKRVKIGMESGIDSLSLPIAAGILMHSLSTR